MKILNRLPLLLDCLHSWKKRPSLQEFESRYFAPMEPLLRPMLSDWGMASAADLYAETEGLNWQLYREDALKLDPERQEARLLHHINAVQHLLGTQLTGEALLFGAFTMMDGYARFDRGEHRVYLGVDESHGRGAYIDILTVHELTHVARESQPTVWEGFALPPKMSHDDFVVSQPVIEHLFSEGFSCVVSEILVPTDEPWHYAYQSKDTFEHVLRHGPAVDRVVHKSVQQPRGNYHHLYNPSRYRYRMPPYCHYVWAWKWVRTLLAEVAENDTRRLLPRCSKEFQEHALGFKLT